MQKHILAVTLTAGLIFYPMQSHGSSHYPVPSDRPAALDTSESLIGIQGYPFHAVVEAVWTTADAKSITRIHGEIWRNNDGDVRLDTITLPSESGASSTLSRTEVIRVAAKVGFFWSSDATNATEVRFRTYPATLFESALIPNGLRVFHSLLAECRQGKAKCQTIDLGRRLIGDVPATGSRTFSLTYTDPLGITYNSKHTRDVWIDPKARIVRLIKDEDARQGTFKMSLSNVSYADQKSALFQVPANYKINTLNAVR